jgi:hypothetical protein
MATVANLQVQIGATIKGLEGSLKKAESSLNKFAKNAQAIGATMSTYFTTPIVGGLGLAVKAASDAEETFSKFATVFRDVQEQAENAFSTLRNEYGLSATASKQLLGDTGDLLTGFGFAQSEALRLSTEVQKLAVDLASFTNFSGGAEGASQALTKALLGERESVKALGIAILEEDVQKQMAINTAKGLTFATERQAKAQATLDLAIQQSTNAIGDYARTSDSFANQLRLVQTRISDLSVEIGQILLPYAEKLLQRTKDLLLAFKNLDTGTKTTVLGIVAITAAIGPALVGLGLMAKGLTTVKALLLFTYKNPYVLVAAGVIALTGYFATLYVKAKRVNDLLKEPFDSTLPIDEQIKKAIERVDALDKRVAGMRNIGATSGAGFEAQQAQLRVAENRLSVERQMLIELIAQKKTTDEATESNRANVQVTQTHITALQSISAELEKNQAKIDAILDINGQITDEQYGELSALLKVNNELNNQVKLRNTIANLAAKGQDPDLSRNVQRGALPEFGGLQQRKVDADAYANSMSALGSKINQVSVDTSGLGEATTQTSGAFEFMSGIANQFADSFGAGLANVIVQGEKLRDVLKNIGKLLLSAAIQKGISLLLTGGLESAGTGFFGSGGGLFGKLFKKGVPKTSMGDGMITSTGKIVRFSPKDNILAMKDFGGLGGGKADTSKLDELINIARKTLMAIIPVNSTLKSVGGAVASDKVVNVGAPSVTVNVPESPPPQTVVVNPPAVNPPNINLYPNFSIPGLDTLQQIPGILVNFVDTIANFGNNITQLPQVQGSTMNVVVTGQLVGDGTTLYAVIKNVERSYR